MAHKFARKRQPERYTCSAVSLRVGRRGHSYIVDKGSMTNGLSQQALPDAGS